MEATVAFTRSLSIKANGSIKAELMSVKQSGLNAGRAGLNLGTRYKSGIKTLKSPPRSVCGRSSVA